MRVLIFLVSVFISIKTIIYGIIVFKNEQNKCGGISVISIGILTFILPTIIIFIR